MSEFRVDSRAPFSSASKILRSPAGRLQRRVKASHCITTAVHMKLVNDIAHGLAASRLNRLEGLSRLRDQAFTSGISRTIAEKRKPHSRSAASQT